MTARPIDERRAAVAEAIEAGSFGDAELDGLCAEFGVTRRTIERDARGIREAKRAARRADLHVLPSGSASQVEQIDPDALDWRTATREDGYVWMLERLAGMAVDPRAIAPAKVGAIKTLSTVFDQLHAHRAEQAGNKPEAVDPAQMVEELKRATRGMPRKMRRQVMAALS